MLERHGHAIFHCAACEHRFTPVDGGPQHVASVYGDDYFNQGGAGYSDYLAEQTTLVASGRRYGELLAGLAPPGRILDVGSAAGFVLKGLVQAGFTGFGVEPNAAMGEYARTKTGVDVRTGTLEQLDADALFDAVSMVQVIGHFYDLRRALEQASRVTRPGGLWLIEAWDYGSLLARTLGASWHEYSPPSVVHWFTQRSLARLLASFGFSEVARGRPKKRIALSHARSLLEYKFGKVARLIPFADRGFSLPYPAFDLFWAVYRKSASL